LYDDPRLATATPELDGLDAAEKKKAIKKAKKAAKKQEEQIATPETKNAKKDDDPMGETLVKTDKPLEEALKFLKPLQELSPSLLETQLLAFDVHFRRGISPPILPSLIGLGKYFQAVGALNVANKIAPGDIKVICCVKTLKEKLVGVEMRSDLKSVMEIAMKKLETVQNGI
jgi:hypothetical protein